MSLKQKISEDLKIAMKAGDALRRDTLRMLDSMVKNVEIEKKKKEIGLSDEEMQVVITRAIKQRKDAIEQYDSAGREELAAKEKAEVEILAGYMPAQMSEEVVREEIKKVISETGAQSKADMGRVMGAVMVKLKGQADGSLVKKIVEEQLQ